MSTPGPDDSPPQSPDELGGLDPKDLFNAGLETVPPVTLPPQPVDTDATVRVTPSSTGIKLEARQELPLPEELTALLPGGNYHVESFLGQGGMGAVYKGTQVRLKRPVAIKIMRHDFGKDHDFEARFEREAQAMAKLNHPNIVSVIDFGEAGPDYLYIVMELVDGADMMDVIRTGRMTQEMALTLLPQICDALQFAHDHGIVHRDIKPSNIMLTRDGRIKMADFGLAKRYDVESSFRTQTGTGMGTPDYAAPEQFDPHAQIDHRADIYALGVMIYQMITGQLPRGVWKPPSQRAEVAPQWDDIVGRAMQSDPADRYQKATEVKTDVSSISLGAVAGVCDPGGGKPSSAKSTPKPSAPPPASQRPATTKSRPALLVGIAASALVLGIVAFFALQKKPSSGRLEPATAAPTPTASKSTQEATPPATTASGDGLKPGATFDISVPASADATTFGGHRYLVVKEQLTWHEAKMKAEAMGGHLAVLTSKEEADFVGNLRLQALPKKPGQTWIGGIREKGKDAPWKWITGEPFSFSNWPPDHFEDNNQSYYLTIQPGDAGTSKPDSWNNWGQIWELERIRGHIGGYIVEWEDEATPSAANKDFPFINSLGMKFVPIANGSTVLFSIWETRMKDFSAFAAAKKVDSSWKIQVKNGVPISESADHPVVGVNFDDAKAFCDWLNEKEGYDGTLPPGMRYRLPTDQEWSTAAGLLKEEGNTPAKRDGNDTMLFPWGTRWPPHSGVGNYADEAFHAKFPLQGDQNRWIEGYRDGIDRTAPVGQCPPTWSGIYDLGGNVWEWCLDSYNGDDDVHVSRGASWQDAQKDKLLTSHRRHENRDTRSNAVGFRVALAPANSGSTATATISVPTTSILPLTPGKWERLTGRLRTEHVSSFGASVTPEGALKMAGTSVRLPIGKTGDIAIRAKVKRPAGTDYTGISVRVDGVAHREILLGNQGGVRLRSTVDGKDILPGAEYKLASDTGDAKPVMLELAVTGSRTYGTVDGKPLNVHDVQDPKGKGDVVLYCGSDKGEFSDIEVMVLDGIPEDKYPAFVLDALAKYRASKVTSAVTAFPPGQWVKLFTKPEDVTADQRQVGMTYEDGWLVGGLSSLRISLPDSLTQNYGVRASFRRSTKMAGAKVADLSRLSIRRTPGGNQHQIGLTGDLASFIHQKGRTSASLTGEVLSAVPKLEDNAVYRLELAAVGARLFARFNDSFLKTSDLSDAPEGKGAILGGEDIRDIEVINLDGLPEAEALRLLGVDEKGNDLRGKQSSVAPVK